MAAICVLLFVGFGCGRKPQDGPAGSRYDRQGKVSPKDGKTIAEWTKKLGEGQARDQANAARALGNIGPKAAKAVPALA
ncbi:hypothetical protein LCGC14_1963160, partial [marine sediment metagenome]